MNKEQLLQLLALADVFNDAFPEKIDTRLIMRRAMTERGETFGETYNAVEKLKKRMEADAKFLQ
jgi:hypothetical protein